MVHKAKRKNNLTAFLYSYSFPVCWLFMAFLTRIDWLGPRCCAHVLAEEGPLFKGGWPQVWCGSPLILGLSWEQRPGTHGSQRGAPLLGMYRRIVEVFSHGRWGHLSIPSDMENLGLTSNSLLAFIDTDKPLFGFWSEAAFPLLQSHHQLLWELERLRQIIDTNHDQRRNGCHCKNVFINDLHIILWEWYSARQNCNRFSPNGNIFLQKYVALKGVKKLNMFPPVREMTDQGQETIH